MGTPATEARFAETPAPGPSTFKGLASVPTSVPVPSKRTTSFPVTGMNLPPSHERSHERGGCYVRPRQGRRNGDNQNPDQRTWPHHDLLIPGASKVYLVSE